MMKTSNHSPYSGLAICLCRGRQQGQVGAELICTATWACWTHGSRLAGIGHAPTPHSLSGQQEPGTPPRPTPFPAPPARQPTPPPSAHLAGLGGLALLGLNAHGGSGDGHNGSPAVPELGRRLQQARPPPSGRVRAGPTHLLLPAAPHAAKSASCKGRWRCMACLDSDAAWQHNKVCRRHALAVCRHCSGRGRRVLHVRAQPGSTQRCLHPGSAAIHPQPPQPGSTRPAHLS